MDLEATTCPVSNKETEAIDRICIMIKVSTEGYVMTRGVPELLIV